MTTATAIVTLKEKKKKKTKASETTTLSRMWEKREPGEMFDTKTDRMIPSGSGAIGQTEKWGPETHHSAFKTYFCY